MVLNKDKFELISYKINKDTLCKTLLNNLPFNSLFDQYIIDKDFYVSPSFQVKDLGLLISSNMNWENHILNLHKASIQISAWILNTFYSRD